MSDTTRTIKHLPFRSTLDLKGLRFMAGEADTGTGAATGAAGTADATAAGTATTQQDAGTAGAAAANTVDELPAWAQKEIKDLRTEAAANRTSTKDLGTKLENLTKGLAGALGLTPEQETDPAKLQASVAELTTQVAAKDTDLTRAQSESKAKDLYIEVAALAHPLGGNARLLLKNQDFLTSIASVDPTDEAAITASITAAIQANAALKATPQSSGSDGHQGGQVKDLEAKLADATKAGDHGTAISLKRQIAALRNTP